MESLLALIFLTVASFLFLCVGAGTILAVLLKMGWVYRRWSAITIATGLLIAMPLYVYLSQHFEIQQCLQDGDADLNRHCGGGLGGVLLTIVTLAMIALSFIVGPIMGSRLHRRWGKDGK